MKKKLMLLSFMAFFIIISQNILADMAPMELIVNHDAKECSLFFRGDEYIICSVPDGWQSLGNVPETSCPGGYILVDTDFDRPSDSNCVDGRFVTTPSEPEFYQRPVFYVGLAVIIVAVVVLYFVIKNK